MAMQDSDVIAKLKRIIDEYGISTFSYHAKANALVSDFFPGGENERTRRLIKALIDCDAFIKISKANSGNIDGVCKSIKYVLIDVESLSEERAEIAIGWVCGSMGKRAPSFPPINPAKSNNQSASSNSNNHGTSSSRPIQPTPQNTNSNMGVNQYGQYGIDPNYVVKRKRVRRNVPKPLIISLIAFVVALVGGFSVITLINNNKIDTVENLISALPDDENYYLDYQAEIVDAYAAYMELDEKLQGKVENADKLMSVMDGLKVAEAYEQRQNMQFTKLDGGGYSVKLKEGANSQISGELVIPGIYRQEPVVAIEDYAFENCRSVTSVNVPDSITQIGVGAFKGCNNIQSMVLPFTGKSCNASTHEAVFGYIFGYEVHQGSEDGDASTSFVNSKATVIDDAIWQYSCYNGSSAWAGQILYIQSYYYYIPQSIQKVIITNQSIIQDAAFNGCNNIESIKYNATIEKIGMAAFQNCSSLLSFNSDSAHTVDLSGLQDSIGAYAFKNCKEINNIIFPDNIRRIENNAFEECRSIESITFPAKLSYIGDYAFKGLRLIKNLDVHNNVTSIGKGAFQGCDSIENISLPFTGRSNDATAYEAVFGYIFGYEVHQGSEDGDSSTDFVNSKAKNIDGAIWQYSCYNGSSAWAGRVLYIQSYYYYIPQSIKTVTISNQGAIQDAAFNGCNKIEKIDYGIALEKMGIAAFQDCKSLSMFNSNHNGTADLTGQSSSIGDYFMKNCVMINHVVFSDKVSVIGAYAFEKISVTSLTFPSSVDTIKIGALRWCNDLQTLSIPFIGKSTEATAYEAVLGYIFGYEVHQGSDDGDSSTAFVNSKAKNIDGAIWQYSCYNGSSAWAGRILYIQSYYYYIPSNLKEVIVSNQSAIPVAAFNGCNMIESITFNQGIGTQGEAAFQNCSATVNKGN